MMKNKILVLITLLSTSYVFAQNAMTIEDCIKYGIENSVISKNAKLDEEIAKAKVKETTGIGLPNISSTANYTDLMTKPTTVFPAEFVPPGGENTGQFGTKFNADIDITVNQLIFDGSYLIGLKAAKTYKMLAEKQANLSNTEIAVNIQKAYYAVLINEERAKLLKLSVGQIDSTLTELNEMHKAGFIEKVDVDRTKVSRNNLKVQSIKIQRLKDLSYSLLKLQMGMPLNEKIELSSSISDFSVELPADESYSLKDRPEFQLLEVQKELTKLDLKNQKVKYLPSIVGFYNFKKDAQRDEFNLFRTSSNPDEYPWFNTEVFGLKMTIPIFDGGQTHFRVQQKKMELLKAENDISQLKNGLEIEVLTAKMQLQNSIDELAIQKENQALAAEVYRVSKEKYTNGVGSNLELINAESSKVESDNNYYNALYNALLAKLDLQKATGKLQY
jgi:outer membrane protein TolC